MADSAHKTGRLLVLQAPFCEMDGYTWPEAWRYSLGVAPTHFLKVVQKLLSLEKPVRKQTSCLLYTSYSRENLKVICFDEPTASLSDSEIESLFNIIQKLKEEGKIIIYVST